MRIVIAPGTFKGTLTAFEAADAMARGARAADEHAVIERIPVADGGEGTAAALSAAIPGCIEHVHRVTGPMGGPVDASFITLGPDHGTAALDMASASGLLLVPPSERNPMLATTYGVGELICAAREVGGVERLIVGLGGSATNDCGCGCLQALGFRLLNHAGRVLPAPLLPSDLALVAAIAPAPYAVAWETDIVIACDVDNPLTGTRGASRVFGPQKGATAGQIEVLDDLLVGFGAVLDDWNVRNYPNDVRPRIQDRPAAGAAGGLGAALMAAFRSATVRPGIEIVLDFANFDSAVRSADLVLTGEGRLDAQTLSGKAIAGVLRRGIAAGVPVVAIVGSAEYSAEAELRRQGIADVVQLVELAGSVDEAMEDADRWVFEAAKQAVADWYSRQ